MEERDLVNTEWRLSRTLTGQEMYKVTILLHSLGAVLYNPSLEDYVQRTEKYPFLLHRPLKEKEDGDYYAYSFLFCSSIYYVALEKIITYEELMYNLQKMIENGSRFSDGE